MRKGGAKWTQYGLSPSLVDIFIGIWVAADAGVGLMAICDNNPRIVVVVPFFAETDFALPEKEAARAEDWSKTRWAKCYPEQFVASFPHASFLNDPIRPEDILRGWGEEFVRVDACQAVLFDQQFGVLILTLEWLPAAIEEEKAMAIYDALCKFQEQRSQALLGRVLPGARVTWSFSINVLVNFDRKFSEADNVPAFQALCHSYTERQAGISERKQDTYEVFHEVGSTGAICFIRSKNRAEYSVDRVVGLWAIFYAYFAYSIEDYALMARDHPPSYRKVRNRQLIKEVRKYVDIHNRLMRRINLFDPFNICERAFDEEIYVKCWKILKVDDLTNKMNRLSYFFINNAQDMQREISGRYESVVQSLLFFITIVQAIPVFHHLLPGSIQEDYMLGRLTPFAISVLLALVWMFVARYWSSR